MSTRRLGCAVSLTFVAALAVAALSATSSFAFLGRPLVSQITEAPAGTPILSPWGLTFDASGNLFVGAVKQGQVDVFNSTNVFQSAIGAGTLSSQYPRSVAVDRATGDVYVADSGADEVFVFKPVGGGKYVLLSRWNGKNSVLGSFGGGYVSVAIDNSASVSDPHAGDVYVLTTQSAIDVFKPKPSGAEEALEGDRVAELSTPGFFLPSGGVGVAVDASTGSLYVPDSGNQAVDEFNDEGTFVQAFKAPGESFRPVAVGIEESTHDVYVVDEASKAVDQFDNTGNLIGGTTFFVSPVGVAVSQTGQVYVSDTGSEPPAVDILGPTTLLPDVTTGAASEVERTSVKLEGVVNPDGETVTSCQFEYGTSTIYGQTIACAPAPGSGTSPVTVNAGPSGLTPETTYHYRLAAGNAKGVHSGADRTFATPVAVDGVLTGPATEIQPTSVTLNGSLEPNGVDAHYWFEYGPEESYGSTTIHKDAGSASAAQPANTAITGLEPNTTYHFRLVTENVYGITYGLDETLKTGTLPPFLAPPSPVSAITRVTAVISGALNPEKSPTTLQILYGETTAYGEHTPIFEVGAGLGEQTFKIGLEGLAPNTTYHYKIEVTNQAGNVTSPDQTFTTSSSAPPTALTGNASNITLTTATITGTIDAQGLETSYEFDLGTDTTYGTSIYGEAGSQNEPIELSLALQNLAPGTTYHYRIVAINSDGKTNGTDQTFTTPAYSTPIVLPFALPLLQTPPIVFPTETGTTPTTTKTLTRTQKLERALKACKKKTRKQRANCEKQAHKKYGAANKTKNKKKA